ncbi:hypothetical protein AAG906_017953 [Vitis piasezkii]
MDARDPMVNKVSNHLQPWHRLEGKVVMVIGASSALGRDFCLDLAKAGSNIIAVARRTHRLNSLFATKSTTLHLP